MSAIPDYYAMLGILPEAEDVVVRAAYRALAQRYHPDRYTGPTEFAHERMAELNEAFAILSDKESRRRYDESRSKEPPSAEEALRTDAANPEPSYDPLEADWRTAVFYYPDLAEIEAGLSRISWRLCYFYRTHLLEKKNFESRREAADILRTKFLETYFGSRREILKFAIELIEAGNRAGALMLNEAVRVLGNNADPRRIIGRVREAFPISDLDLKASEMKRYGITREGDFWIYGGYKYEYLEDAIAYAKLLKSKGRT